METYRITFRDGKPSYCRNLRTNEGWTYVAPNWWAYVAAPHGLIKKATS